MEDVLIPQKIMISEIIKNKCNLSPTNYRKVDIKNQNRKKLSSLLELSPFIRGTETGASAYLRDFSSNIKFVRNSCVDKLNYIVQLQKTVFLNEYIITYCEEQLINNGDLLLATDANIGDCAVFLSDDSIKYLISSGMVKLNLVNEVNKYYLCAMLKDSYFNAQLDAMTPRGSTIRHSGSNFLQCEIPYPQEDEMWVIETIEILMKNIIYSEKRAIKIQTDIFEMYDSELKKVDITPKTIGISELLMNKRVDAGFYSEEVQDFFQRVEKYPNGNKTLHNLGYKTKRGPSLQIRDLGRSIKNDYYNSRYSLLIYPSDISDYGFIDKTIFLGAAGKVWFLEKNDILFSAEGNVGKTFIICDEDLRFTTNIHGIIISPIDGKKDDLKNTIFIGTFLNYMKRKGVMDKLSVGGQGGSFAVQYWDILTFPNIGEDVLNKLKELYYSEKKILPFEFDEHKINELGIYEVNKLRTLCSSMLRIIIDDIKADELKEKQYYMSKLC